jgi:hypothetical protein
MRSTIMKYNALAVWGSLTYFSVINLQTYFKYNFVKHILIWSPQLLKKERYLLRYAVR